MATVFLKCMKKFTPVAAISVMIAVMPSGSAQAVTFIDNGGAGETLNTAQVIPSGSLPLESISGTLFGNANLFQIFLTGNQTFSATTISPDTLIDIPTDNLLGAPTDILEDPQLFLFDSSGKAVYGNDDSFGSPQATLPSGIFSPKESGLYYLAISSSGYAPVSNKGAIFSDAPIDGILRPTDPGSGLPLDHFEGTSTTKGRYTIYLTGVQTSAKSVPEPASTLGLLAVGAWGASRYKNKKKLKKQAGGVPSIV